MKHYRISDRFRLQLQELLDAGRVELMCTARATDSIGYARACTEHADEFSGAIYTLQCLEEYD